MASSSKTEILRLNQWVKTDPVLMDDFNADNCKIEAAVTVQNQAIAGMAEDMTDLRQDLSAIEAGLRLEMSATIASMTQQINTAALANPWEKLFEKLTTTTVGGIEIVVTGKIDLSKYYALRVNYIDENSRKPGIKMLIDAEESATSYQRVSGTTVTNADIISDEGGYLEIDLCNAKVCVRGSAYFWRVPNLNVTAMRSFTVMPYSGGVMTAGNRVSVYGLKK